MKKGLFALVNVYLGYYFVERNLNPMTIYLKATTQNQQYLEANKYLSAGKSSNSFPFLFAWSHEIYYRYFDTVKFIKHQIEEIEQCTVIKVPSFTPKTEVEKSSIPRVLLVSSTQGFDSKLTKAMLQVHDNKFEVIGIVPKDFYDEKTLIKVVNQLKKDHPSQPHYAVGMEYGANLLLNAASMQQDLFKGVITLASPIDVEASERKLSNSILGRSIRKLMVAGKAQRFGHKFIDKNASFDQLDAELYKLSGQALHEFKLEHSCCSRIPNLTVPALIIQSKSDPFCPSIKSKEFPQECLENEHIIWVETRIGGHNNWFTTISRKNWAMLAAVEHIKILNSRRLNSSK